MTTFLFFFFFACTVLVEMEVHFRKASESDRIRKEMSLYDL